jgi:hypothetical protein
MPGSDLRKGKELTNGVVPQMRGRNAAQGITPGTAHISRNSSDGIKVHFPGRCHRKTFTPLIPTTHTYMDQQVLDRKEIKESNNKTGRRSKRVFVLFN